MPKLSDTILNFDFPVPVFPQGQNPDLPANQFVYNFYEPRESVDDTGQAYNAVPGSTRSDKPRYTVLSFKLPSSPVVQSVRFSDIDLANDEVDNSGNTPTVKPELINNETNSQVAPRYLNIGLQDLNVVGKMHDLVVTTARKKIAEENAKISKEIDAEKESFLRRASQSQSDLVRVLRRQLPGNRPPDDFLADAINNIGELNESYINDEEAAEVAQSAFELAKNAKFDASLNTKFIASLVNSSVTDPIGTYAEEFLPLKGVVEKVQKDAISNYRAQDSTLGDLSVSFIESTLHMGQQPDIALNSVDFKFSGFVLEKTEVKADGSIVLLDKRVINPADPQANQPTEFLDINVAYGRNYVYQVSALFLGSILVPNVVPPRQNTAVKGPGTTDALKKFFFVQSAKSKALFINTIEKVAPRPPVNLKVAWHQEAEGALITWNHPANPQKDIKRFQLFRRSSVQEAFELLVEYDFDYSEVLYSSGEQVEPYAKIKVKKPVYHFVDKNIDLDRDYIYAVRSIDAHGLGSGYSMQIACKYNRFTNRIDSSLLSPQGTMQGTPVQYPNFFIEQSKFVDTIKDSGHSRLKIYFDPEYLRLYKKSGPQGESREDLKLFNFDGRGNGLNGTANFQLQMLNTDLQQSQTVDIIIADDRRD
jgi:hypothetical protein